MPGPARYSDRRKPRLAYAVAAVNYWVTLCLLRASVSSAVVWLSRSASTRTISIGHFREFREQPQEMILADAQRLELRLARTVAVRDTSHRMAISPTIEFGSTSATLIWPLVGIDQHIGFAGKDDIGGVAVIALLEQHLAGAVGHPVGGERQQLQLRRLDAGEQAAPAAAFPLHP